MGFVLVIVLAALGLGVALIYNSLAQLRLLADNAWADIDVQLKRRHDLVPTLVAAVKGHAGYEKGPSKPSSRPATGERRGAGRCGGTEGALGQPGAADRGAGRGLPGAQGGAEFPRAAEETEPASRITCRMPVATTTR